jgi:Zn-dependent protease
MSPVTASCYTRRMNGSRLDPTYLAELIVSILVSLVIHEFMHAYTAHLLGDKTADEAGRLSLNPLKHIDPLMTVALPIMTLLLFGAPVLAAKPVPFNMDRVKYEEFGAALIALAGPLSNLVLAFVVALIAQGLAPGTFIHNALDTFIILNVALFVFNLVPIPPLDGSRVLYAFAPEPLQRFMADIEPYGLFIVFGLIFVANLGGFLGNINQFILNLLP